MPQQRGDGLRLGGEHRRLVDHADTPEVALGVEACGIAVLESVEEKGRRGLASDHAGQVAGFVEVAHDNDGGGRSGVR